MIGIKPCVLITPWCMDSMQAFLRAQQLVRVDQMASAVYWTANLATFYPFTLTMPATFVKLFCYNGGAVNGNVDMAIYDKDGTKLTSAVNAAQAGINSIQEFDITDVTIGPGQFYLAIVLDNIVGTLFQLTGVWSTSYTAHSGMARMVAAYPLPAVAVLATSTVVYVPAIGATTRSVI